MKTLKLNISDALSALGAVNGIMRVPGLEARKAYWLDRLRKRLEVAVKKYEGERKKIFDKYATAIPEYPFIPPDSYNAFKQDLLFAIQEKTGDILSVFEKYEKTSTHGGQMGIDMSKKNDFETDLMKLEDTLEVEVEYSPVTMDDNTRAVMSRLPGDLQKSLYCFLDGEVDEESKIVIAQDVSAFAGSKLIH